ncbi:MAG: hypothetical protein ABFS86_17770 [Planctomycetota bacterium]
MHLISLSETDPRRIAGLIDAPAKTKRAAGGVVVLLDFLPLGPCGLALRAAAARAGLTFVTGAEILPGFPAKTDLLAAARHAGAFADAVLVRHPLTGAARAAAAVSAAPVLSLGDGTGEDAVSGIAELAALAGRLDGLAGRSVALCGDLRRNRTAHALAGGLLAAGARTLLVPAKGAAPEDGFLDALARRFGSHPVRFEARTMSSLLDMVDSWLLTPDLDHQLDLFADVVTSSKSERRAVRHQVREVHALWVAAPRDDRGEPRGRPANGSGLPGRDPDGRILISPAEPCAAEETDPAEDAPARVAALAALLVEAAAGGVPASPLPEEAYVAAEGARCERSTCVACREPARVPAAFVVTRTDPVLLTCAYCHARRQARFVGSRVERRYHQLTSGQVRKIKRKNTVFFATEAEARAAGFVPSKV